MGRPPGVKNKNGQPSKASVGIDKLQQKLSAKQEKEKQKAEKAAYKEEEKSTKAQLQENKLQLKQYSADIQEQRESLKAVAVSGVEQLEIDYPYFKDFFFKFQKFKNAHLFYSLKTVPGLARTASKFLLCVWYVCVYFVSCVCVVCCVCGMCGFICCRLCVCCVLCVCYKVSEILFSVFDICNFFVDNKPPVDITDCTYDSIITRHLRITYKVPVKVAKEMDIVSFNCVRTLGYEECFNMHVNMVLDGGKYLLK